MHSTMCASVSGWFFLSLLSFALPNSFSLACARALARSLSTRLKHFGSQTPQSFYFPPLFLQLRIVHAHSMCAYICWYKYKNNFPIVYERWARKSPTDTHIRTPACGHRAIYAFGANENLHTNTHTLTHTDAQDNGNGNDVPFPFNRSLLLRARL